ncbi:class C beta-lactamase-related serine hydrolase [Paenibacillus albiflavus]|uniref:Class C beta-lactamase-related serine hydrolase n=1 Tax=Paenibacillus albiflavus TaxID=2545760 RepID=A0A4R4E090_9BACL|nr:serine hydrolase [Paenibacillus albiflavus]TCZ68606.1 class C beta-lactamase-related serine hydrolase [Paenibacillus albiflavus]
MHQTNRLPRLVPEQLGIRSSAIAAWVEGVERSGQELHSFMLLRKGAVAAEGWWAPYEPEQAHMAFSLSKSFTSTAVGMAIEEGLLALDDRVLSFFSEKIDEAVEQRYSTLTVRHLLTMSSGHGEDPKKIMLAAEDGDWVQAFLHTEPIVEPGVRFLYSSGVSYMLSAIMQTVTGQTLLDYLEPRLFQPLGIERPYWESCPMGRNAGGWGLRLKTEDIAKFGQLYLQRGRWKGVQLVPEAWVAEATAKQISNENGGPPDWSEGYGYQFWRCRHGAYRGDGAFGQYCIVLPEQEVVLAATGGLTDMQVIVDLVWEHLLPTLQKGTTDETIDLQLVEKERNRWSKLALPLPLAAGSSLPVEAKLAALYKFEDNPLGWTEFSLTPILSDASISAIVCWKDMLGEHHIHCGSEGWIRGMASLQGEIRPIAAFGLWRENDTYEMTLYRTDAPYKDTFKFYFSGDRVIVDIERNIDFGPGPYTIRMNGYAVNC